MSNAPVATPRRFIFGQQCPFFTCTHKDCHCHKDCHHPKCLYNIIGMDKGILLLKCYYCDMHLSVEYNYIINTDLLNKSV